MRRLVCLEALDWGRFSGTERVYPGPPNQTRRSHSTHTTLVSWFQVPLDGRHLVRSERYFLARLSNKTVDVVCYDVLVHGTTISGVASCCRGYNSTHVMFCIDNTAWIPSVYKLEQA